MGTYILSISAVAITSTIMCILSSEKYVKYISFVSSLIMMLVLLSPLMKVKNITISPSIHENTSTIETINMKETASRALARSISEVISGKYGNDECIRNITIKTSEGSDFEVTSILITLNASVDLGDTASLSKYLSEIYGVAVTINEDE